MHRWNCTCDVCVDEKDTNPYATENTSALEDYDVWEDR